MLPLRFVIALRVIDPAVGGPDARISALVKLATDRLKPSVGKALLILLGLTGTSVDRELPKERQRLAAIEVGSTKSNFARRLGKGYLEDLALEIHTLDSDVLARDQETSDLVSRPVDVLSGLGSSSERPVLLSAADRSASPNDDSRGRVKHSLGRKSVLAVSGVALCGVGLVSWILLSSTTALTSNGGFSPPGLVNPAYCPTPTPPPKASSTGIYVGLAQEPVAARKCWTNVLAPVRPGSTLSYLVTYRNASTNEQDNVVVKLEPGLNLLLLPQATWLYNEANPKGVRYHSEVVSSRGIVIGNYNPGGGAYVTVRVAVPAEEDFSCGVSDVRSHVLVGPEGSSYASASADFQVSRTC